MRPSALIASALLVAAPAGGQTAPAERPRVLAEFPHDAEAFTQGLLLHQGAFYESTGLLGRSTLRRVEPTTGEPLEVVPLPESEFGEGLALVGERLLQLTWKNGLAHVYDRETLREIAAFPYEGEGWGLCFDGERLVMSDGSHSLFFRDPETFELLGSLEVTLDGAPLERLNELECVGSFVYANVWQTDLIVQIDAETGRVRTRIDCSGLLDPEAARAADVLNGIAHDPATRHFFLTGKLWPTVFEVRFDFDGDGSAVGTSGAAPGTSAPARPEGTSATGDSAKAEALAGCGVARGADPGALPWLLSAVLGILCRFGIAFGAPWRHSRHR